MEEPPGLPPAAEAANLSSKGSDMQLMADTVGLVPSMRMKDNVRQGIVVGICVLIGTPIGFFLWGGYGALIGALGGLVAGGLGSGTVLMIQGLKRASRK